MFRRILCFYQKTHTIRSIPLSSSSSSSSSKDVDSIMKKLMDDKEYKQVLDLFDKQTKPCNDVITQMVIKACIHLNKHQRITDIQEKLSPQLLNNSYIQTTLIQFYSELLTFFCNEILDRCEASTMELAPRNKELYKNLYKNEFPSIKVSLFVAELNSASNGDTFIHEKTIGKNFT